MDKGNIDSVRSVYSVFCNLMKIKCTNRSQAKKLRVRVIKAPLVDTTELKRIILARAKALVL